MKNQTSLVTGGAGFIGSHVVDHLIEMDHQVIVLDDLSGGFRQHINPKATFVEGSILDHHLIEALFEKHHFTYVYHLAAYAAEGLSHFIRRFNYTNNITGSVNLINASVKFNVKRFVFTSSIAVYGDGALPHRETQIPQPEDPYGIAKYAIEMDLKAAKSMFGLDYIIFRPHNVFGERQNIADRYRNVIGIFMNQVLQQKPLTIFGDGEQSRAFSYIDVVAPIIARSVAIESAKNQIFNIGSDRPTSLNQLVDVLRVVTELDSEVVHHPTRNEVTHAYADHSKLKEVFGQSKSETSFNEGLKRMWKWVQIHGAQETSNFGSIELTKNLPASWKKQP